MKLISNITNAQDIKKFIYCNSWSCEYLQKLKSDDLDRICELVTSICECYEEMTEAQLNDLLQFDEEVKSLYCEIIEKE